MTDSGTGSQAESLLSIPVGVLPKLVRASPNNVVIHHKFDNSRKRRNFSIQYAHSYNNRLGALRPVLADRAYSVWPNVEIIRISELCQLSQSKIMESETKNAHRLYSTVGTTKPDKTKRNVTSDEPHGQRININEDKPVVLIGTIFKVQPEKPSILQEFSEDKVCVDFKKEAFTSDRDYILFEDETSRVQLILRPGCGLSVNGVVNGIVCAVMGKPNSNGRLEVAGVIFPQPIPAIFPTNKLSEELVFISGLEFGSDTYSKSPLLQADLLFDYLKGLAGAPSEHIEQIHHKRSVFFIGNSFPSSSFSKYGEERIMFTELTIKLDKALDQLAQTMNVYIMPGESDPSEPMLPQNPIHRAIIPCSSKRTTLTSLTNPARVEFNSDGAHLDVLLSSGQNVDDGIRNCEISSPLEMAERLLQWGHICPTAPDTLALHPGVDDDVFIIERLPHLFVIGNQKSFGVSGFKNTKILTVPSFARTGTVILMDKNFNFSPLVFKLF